MIKSFNPATNIIYVDMDGVLADFEGFVSEKMGHAYDTNLPDDDYMWKFLLGVPNLYKQLRPTPYAFELWHACHSYGAKVEVLTGIPRRFPRPDSIPDKEEWMHLYFSPDVKVNFGPYAGDKWKWAKNGDILIDDRPGNIQDWINHGFGIGILHKQSDVQPTLEALEQAATEHLRR